MKGLLIALTSSTFGLRQRRWACWLRCPVPSQQFRTWPPVQMPMRQCGHAGQQHSCQQCLMLAWRCTRSHLSDLSVRARPHLVVGTAVLLAYFHPSSSRRSCCFSARAPSGGPTRLTSQAAQGAPRASSAPLFHARCLRERDFFYAERREMQEGSSAHTPRRARRRRAASRATAQHAAPAASPPPQPQVRIGIARPSTTRQYQRQ